MLVDERADLKDFLRVEWSAVNSDVESVAWMGSRSVEMMADELVEMSAALKVVSRAGMKVVP